MGDLGIAKPGSPFEDRPVIPVIAASTEIWARVAQIFFATIFSVALVWVVIRIWNGDGPEDGKNDDQKK